MLAETVGQPVVSTLAVAQMLEGSKKYVYFVNNVPYSLATSTTGFCPSKSFIRQVAWISLCSPGIRVI